MVADHTSGASHADGVVVATSWLTRGWKYLVVRGVLALVFGVVAMLWPLSTVMALAILWGVWALVDGVSSLAQAFREPAAPVRWALLGTGVLALVVAFLAIFSPGLTGAALTWVLGVWLMARGVLECVLALVNAIGKSRLVLLLSALVDMFLGTLFVSNPGRAAVGIAVLLGLTAVVWGVSLVALGVWVGRHDRIAGSQVR